MSKEFGFSYPWLLSSQNRRSPAPCQAISGTHYQTQKYSRPCASGNALNLHLISVTLPSTAHSSAAACSHCRVFPRERNSQASTQRVRRPSHRYSSHSSLSSHIFPNGFFDPATSTPQNNRHLQPQPADPPHQSHHLFAHPCGIITLRDHRCHGVLSPPAPQKITCSTN